MELQAPIFVATPHGFAGSLPVSWTTLATRLQRHDLVFFSCNQEINRRYGTPNPGSADVLREHTHTMPPVAGAYDLGTLADGPATAAMENIVLTSERISRHGGLPVLVACDHTASLGNLLGSATYHLHEPIIYVYLDAHYDLGRNCDAEDILHNGGFLGKVLEQDWVCCAVNIGGRSVTTHINYPDTPEGFISIPADRPVEEILADMVALKGKTIYLSLDADVVDPSQSPSVPCPEELGMPMADVLACCRWLGENCTIIGMDLTETLPAENTIAAEQGLFNCLLAAVHPSP